MAFAFFQQFHRGPDLFRHLATPSALIAEAPAPQILAYQRVLVSAGYTCLVRDANMQLVDPKAPLHKRNAPVNLLSLGETRIIAGIFDAYQVPF